RGAASRSARRAAALPARLGHQQPRAAGRLGEGREDGLLPLWKDAGPGAGGGGLMREPELLGQTVVVIGGSAGIGFATARRAREEGARVILTARSPEPLQRAATELGALGTAAFDATDPASLERFFRDLSDPVDHVMVTAGQPHYGRLVDMDFE